MELQVDGWLTLLSLLSSVSPVASSGGTAYDPPRVSRHPFLPSSFPTVDSLSSPLLLDDPTDIPHYGDRDSLS